LRVRVTGSGLGCTTWPKCTAESFTPTKAQSNHGMIEWANRLFTGAVSLSVMIAVLGSLMLKKLSKKLTWLSIGLVFGIIAQIVLGGITVLVKLHPLAVGAHMLVSLLILANAVVLCYCAKQDGEVSLKKLFQPTANFLLYIVTNLIVLAGIVVTAAGPHAGSKDTVRLDASIETVVRIHSGLAWVFTILILVLFFKYKNRSWQLKSLFVVTLCQIAWGYSQYFNGVPAWMVIIHVFLAALLYTFSCLNWTRSLGPSLAGSDN
jgi:cytochrome c oxidase assembly protein subunit 15